MVDAFAPLALKEANMNTKLEQVLKDYETRIKEGRYVKTFTERVKNITRRFFKRKTNEEQIQKMVEEKKVQFDPGLGKTPGEILHKLLNKLSSIEGGGTEQL